MKVVYLSGDVTNRNYYKNVLCELSEQTSLIFIDSIDSYKAFVEKSLINLQEDVDCIICDNCGLSKNYITSKEVLAITQFDESKTYSYRNFKLNSLPVILIIKDDLDIDTAKTYGFSSILKIENIDDFKLIIPKVKNNIKSWRRKLLDELDNIGIRFNSGMIDYKKFDFKKSKKTDTRIISESFRLVPRKLNYSWIEANNKQIEEGIDKLVKILKQYEQNKHLREENKIQSLFKKNPYLLRRDIYSEQLHETYFHDPRPLEEDKKPDFLLKPSLTFNTDLSVIEVKLPNEFFLKKKRHIKNFYSNIWEYLCQINDYKEYLENEAFQEYVYKKLKENPVNISYQLLIGRLSDKEDALYFIKKRFKQFNLNPNLLLTYDELLNLQKSFLDRLNYLEVR